MSEPRRVCPSGDLKDSEPRGIQVDGRSVVLLKIKDEVHAFSGTCPHRGGPLSAGFVNGQCIVCPWHGWEFDLKSGMYKGAPGVGIDIYPAKLEDGYVVADLYPNG